MTGVGEVSFTRRYWKCSCGSDGAYAVDTILGVEGERYSQFVQKQCCRLGADQSFAKASEHMHEMLGVAICADTVRTMVEGHGKKMAQFQAQDTASELAFQKAKGEVEFTTDAAKVNTREKGWKDLKIAMVSKRERGEATPPDNWNKQRLPRFTIALAIATVGPAKEFRKSWRPWLKRLGVRFMVSVHALADGASWIWKAVQRVLTGCRQTLDFWHACEHVNKCAERIFGEGTAEKDAARKSAYERGRSLLARQGWAGICQWVSELLDVPDETERERRRKATGRLIVYFSEHTQRLNYAENLQTGRVIGSGQVEGEAKTLGLRMKNRGARWNIANVRPMASLVCVRNTSQWEAYWASMAA